MFNVKNLNMLAKFELAVNDRSQTFPAETHAIQTSPQ